MIKNIILDVGGVLFDDGKQKFTRILNMDIEEVTRICDIAFGKNFKQCMLGETSIIDYIKELFDGGVYSFQKHMIKPNQDFYNLLIQRYNLNKEECIFFDDIEKNIKAGLEAGIKSIKYTSIEDIKNNLE